MSFGNRLSLFCVPYVSAGPHGSGIPVRGGRLQTDQLLQLQLLVLCGFVHFGTAVSAMEAARPTETTEGNTISATQSIFFFYKFVLMKSPFDKIHCKDI